MHAYLKLGEFKKIAEVLLSYMMMPALSAPAILHHSNSGIRTFLALSTRTGHLHEQKHMACMHYALEGSVDKHGYSDQQKGSI